MHDDTTPVVGGGHRSAALLLAILLIFGSIITSREIEDEEHQAIWRNTEHTASMLSSLLQDQVQTTAEKLALLHEIHVRDPQLLASIESGYLAALDRKAQAMQQSSLGLVDGVYFYAPDGDPLFTNHQGAQRQPTQASQRARQYGKPAFGLEMHGDDHIHVHYSGPVVGNGRNIAFLDLSTNLNGRLDSINRLLRLEMEQHAASGSPGDTAFGIFRIRSDRALESQLIVTTGNFPLTDLHYIYELIASDRLRGETEGYQYRIVPLHDVSGKVFAAAILALDVATAGAAGHARANRFLILMLLGSGLAVLLFYMLLEANARQSRKSTEKLSSALAAAEEATRAKSEFLANMSHEIRTPMNAVIGLTTLCLHESLSDKVRDYVSKTHAAAEHLLGIINDILDISKIEAGKLTIEDIDFDLDEVVDGVAGLCGMVAAGKALDVFIDIDARTPRRIRGDPLRLAQVLNNLVGNAIKFTNRGQVVIGIAPESRENGIGLRFSVSDTGIGISGEQLDRLFTAFTQADSSSTRKYGGTGLGLVISQRLVELMGGRIEVSSAPGVGSRFSFVLSSRSYPEEAPLPLDGKVIRLVESNPVHARIVQGMLTGLGAHIAGSEIAAADCDLVVVGSHRDAQAELAASGGATPVLHIAPLHAPTLPDAPLVDVVHRPVTRRMLEYAVARRLGSAATLPANVGDVVVRGEFAGCRILLVEDNPLNQFVAADLIAMTGASLKIANNGLEAVQEAASTDWDLILMDIQMPVMDGIAATLAIRQQHKAVAPPIVAMTAHALSEERDRCLAAGMNDFITKPVDFTVLLQLLRRWLKTPEEAPTSAVAMPNAAAVGEGDDLDTVDHEVAMRYAMGETERMMRLVRAFLEQNQDTPARLREHARSDDRDGSRAIAHKLKGSSPYVGAVSLASFAAHVESAAKNDHGDWREQTHRLADALELLTGRLASLPAE